MAMVKVHLERVTPITRDLRPDDHGLPLIRA